MNQALLKEFRTKEVWSALKQMHPTKAPDPDDMSPIFYQKYWDIDILLVLVYKIVYYRPLIQV